MKLVNSKLMYRWITTVNNLIILLKVMNLYFIGFEVFSAVSLKIADS